jgi:hypothetical protein
MTYPAEWFERKVLAYLTNTDQPDACWEWTRSRHEFGYGRVVIPGKGMGYAHRVTYEQLVGPIQPGLVLDHRTCQNPPCANPRHLEPVTDRINLLRGATMSADQAARTHCPQGHELAGGNLTPSLLARGRRDCLTCNRARSAEQHAARRAAREALGLRQSEYQRRYGQSAHVAREILRRTQAGESLDGVRDIAPGHGSWGKRTITIRPDPNRA